MMTFIVIALLIVALFFVIQRKSWFIALGLILLLSFVAIVSSIIQLLTVSIFSCLILAGIIWTRRSVSNSKSRFSAVLNFFGAQHKEQADSQLTESELVKNVNTELDFIDRAKLRRQKFLLSIAMLCVFTLLVAPIVQYGHEFGNEGWQQYQNWVVMGSHLSGVYSLIIALLAFLLLVVKLTLRFKQKQSDYDQAFIRDCKQDLEFYLTELEHYLSQWVNDTCTQRDMLHERCGALSEKKLSSNKVKEQLTEFAMNHPKLLGIWHPLVIILDTLNKPNRYPYKHNHQSCVAKTAGILSLQTSTALDKLAFVVSSESGRNRVYFWEKSKTFSACNFQ